MLLLFGVPLTPDAIISKEKSPPSAGFPGMSKHTGQVESGRPDPKSVTLTPALESLKRRAPLLQSIFEDPLSSGVRGVGPEGSKGVGGTLLTTVIVPALIPASNTKTFRSVGSDKYVTFPVRVPKASTIGPGRVWGRNKAEIDRVSLCASRNSKKSDECYQC